MRAAVLLCCALALGAGGSFDWKTLHRPLHVPHLASGDLCPVSPSRRSAAAGGQPLIGRGPAYLMGVGGASPGEIDISLSRPDASGWRGQKTPWAVRRGSTGPVLIRGRRLDGPGEVRFAIGHGQHLAELRWPAAVDVSRPRSKPYRWFASSTLFRAPGCYAFQVDGLSFSSVVVVFVKG